MRMGKFNKHRLLRFLTLGSAIIGLVLLNHYVSNRPPRLVRIGEISALMNFSVVRVEGVLESEARSLRNGTVMYVINDETGILPVFSSPPPDGKLPRAGSRVSVVGNLSVGAGSNVRLRVQVGEHVAVISEPLENAFISESDLGNLSEKQAGSRITVYGRVSRIWKPRAGSRAPYKIVLEDHSGSLDIVHWLKKPPSVSEGDEVAVTGLMGVYQGRLQLKLQRTDDIKPYIRGRNPIRNQS
jgi:hypothetical protein